MVYQEAFTLEQFMDENEIGIKYNLGETCCYSLSLDQVAELSGEKFDYAELGCRRLAYSDIRASDAVKAEICKLYEGIEPENLVVTNGGIGANYLSFYSLVGPGDHVIALDPLYQQLSSVPKMFGADVDRLPLRFEDGWIPDIAALKKLAKPNTKLIVINNPNNPTGAIIPNSVLKEIVEVARSTGAYVLSDEVYRPLFHSLPAGCEKPVSIAEIYDRGISTSSMSKTFSLAGIRFGWIACRDKQFIDSCWVRRDFNMISVSLVDDAIATYLLRNKDAVLERNFKLCRDNLAIVEKAIKTSNGKLSWVKPVAGTTAFVKVSGLPEGASTMKLATDLVRDCNTLVVPGETFGHPGFLRIGFANCKEDVENGIANILNYLK